MEDLIDNVNPKQAAACCCSSVTVIAAMIICLMSLDSVEPTEYGLMYNNFWKTIDEDTVYEGGLHFVGPFTKFIIFPATTQSIEFSDAYDSDDGAIETRTAEGLALTLHFAFTYSLQKDNIPYLYRLVG
jgi:hypothetical protein